MSLDRCSLFSFVHSGTDYRISWLHPTPISKVLSRYLFWGFQKWGAFQNCFFFRRLMSHSAIQEILTLQWAAILLNSFAKCFFPQALLSVILISLAKRLGHKALSLRLCLNFNTQLNSNLSCFNYSHYVFFLFRCKPWGLKTTAISLNLRLFISMWQPNLTHLDWSANLVFSKKYHVVSYWYSKVPVRNLH